MDHFVDFLSLFFCCLRIITVLRAFCISTNANVCIMRASIKKSHCCTSGGNVPFFLALFTQRFRNRCQPVIISWFIYLRCLQGAMLLRLLHSSWESLLELHVGLRSTSMASNSILCRISSILHTQWYTVILHARSFHTHVVVIERVWRDPHYFRHAVRSAFVLPSLSLSRNLKMAIG